jgi:hypothetical protein
MTGYLDPGYAESLKEFGEPIYLPNSGGWILKRKIPGFEYYDAMGCYPLFCCHDWTKLSTDINDMNRDLISLAIVTDPFGNHNHNNLRRCFKDFVIPFKEHFVTDLSQSLNEFVSNNHRRNARKSLEYVDVERCSNPINFINDWTVLYSNLISRHKIRGIQTFSEKSFRKQLMVPGMVAFRAIYEDKTIGMILWYVQDKICYYHLGAFNNTGYNLRVSFALFWRAIEYFIEMGLEWLNLGADAGVKTELSNGLSRFKKGWSTGTRTSYFCGRIFNQKIYSKIVESKGVTPTDYFPAYRKGEFK